MTKVCPQCNEEYDYKFFTTYGKKGNARCREICNYCIEFNRLKKKDFEKAKRAEKIKQEVASGIKKICKKCHIARKPENISENGVCTVCNRSKKGIIASSICEAKERKSFRDRIATQNKIKMDKFFTPAEEQAQKQRLLDEKVAEFLANKQ